MEGDGPATLHNRPPQKEKTAMAANARTATASRRRATAKPAPTPKPVPEGDFEPVRLVSKPADPDDRVVLFYVDDTAYSIPRKVGRNYGLRFLQTARKQGEAMAAQELLEILIGEDGYEALMACDALRDEDLDRIISQLRDMALGAVEDEPGKKGR